MYVCMYVCKISVFLSFVQAMEVGQLSPSGRHCPARVGLKGWFYPSLLFQSLGA